MSSPPLCCILTPSQEGWFKKMQEEKPPPSLKEMLTNNAHEDSESDQSAATPQEVASTECLNALGTQAQEAASGACVNCLQPAQYLCNECDDEYCVVCFSALHRKGKRAKHGTTALRAGDGAGPGAAAAGGKAPAAAPSRSSGGPFSMFGLGGGSSSGSGGGTPDNALPKTLLDAGLTVENRQRWFYERAQYVPVRLTPKERRHLRLVEGAMQVSDYTSHVDTPKVLKKRMLRTKTQCQDICAIMAGLACGTDFEKGTAVVQNRNFKKYEKFFNQRLENARRHKIMNPEKMRHEYGKLVHLLMDANTDEMRELLDADLVIPIVTVHGYLEARGAAGMLHDPSMPWATQVIVSAKGKSRAVIQREIKQKEKSVEFIAKKYATSAISEDEIRTCLYSMCDNHCFLNDHRQCMDDMIAFLQLYFSPDKCESAGLSLAISGGTDGARLTHSHERQYNFALQSLSLWREITNDMFKLWYLAEQDLLDPANEYKLTDTGQGFNRLQQAPRVYREMCQILHRCQKKIGSWVGSSVIHLGDSNVPNALMFIDKYTQVSRILNPIVTTLRLVDDFVEKDAKLGQWIKASFGSVEGLRKEILHDFFRNAFDGSGGDTFFEAGSCIDGRLTSAWNWCSSLPTKRFYPIFKLTGFTSFDGDFQA